MKASKTAKGFTIIEIMIVLSIAGLILLIVFLAVPALQRNSRNYQRRQAATHVAAELDEYKGNTGKYPFTAAEEQSFVDTYLKSGITSGYIIQYSNGQESDGQPGEHTYTPPLNSIKYELGHWCNTPSDNDGTSNPIQGDDSNVYKYAVWTTLEAGSGQDVLCIDNN